MSSKVGMPITLSQGIILFGAISLFLVVAFALHFLPVMSVYSSSCDYAGFISCRDTFNLQGCIDACPYIPATCPPGTPPNTDCKETDQACSGACWDRGNTHGASCAASTGCTLEQIQILLRGGAITDDPTPVPQQKVPNTTPAAQKTVPLPSQTPVTPPAAEVDESFWENTEEVEALVESAPKPITVQPVTPNPAPDWKEPPKGLDYAVIKEITGDVQFQIEGQKDWQKASVGMKIWNGSLIQTDFDAKVTLDFEGISVVKVEELTQVAIEKFLKEHSPAKAAMALEIHLGDMNLDVNPGSFTADVQIRMGNNTGAVRGTRFGVAYDPETKISVWEIYDGTIEVKNEASGKTVVLTSSYGKPIRRAEISDGGETALKIAIPRDQWGTDKTKSETQDLRIFAKIGLGAVAVIMLAYMLLRKKLKIKIPLGRWFR